MKNGQSTSSFPTLQDLAENNSLWFDQAITEFPSVIAHEYARIRDMLESGETFGVLLQMKDAFEVVLKFPILVIAANILHNQKGISEAERRSLIKLLSKELLLSDWIKVAQSMSKISRPETLELATMVNYIVNEYEHKNNIIVNWRNTTIGHGALRLKADKEYCNDIETKLKLLRDIFIKTAPHYKKYEFKLINGTENVFLHGRHRAYNFGISGGDVLVTALHCSGNITWNLHPFIHLRESALFFFDSRERYGNVKCDILNYPEGHKGNMPIPELTDAYQTHSSAEERERAGHYSVENQTYSQEQQEILDKICTVDDYFEPVHVTSWIKSCLINHPKGIFLLQMDRGTGKTTLTRSLDELSEMNSVALDEVAVRAYYVNDAYLHKVSHFSFEMKDCMPKNPKTGKTLIKGDPPIIRYEAGASEKECRDAFAGFLNFYQTFNIKHNCQQSKRHAPCVPDQESQFFNC